MINTDKLSSHEQEAVKELQLRLQQEFSSQVYEDIVLLIRFLRARNLNVDKAENMLRKHLIFRKSFQADNITENFKPEEVFCKYVLPSDIGLDKEGDMIKYCPVGKIELRDVLKCVKMNDCMKHWIWFSEKNLISRKSLNENASRCFSQIVFILDLDELSFANATYKYSAEALKRITRILTDNYPEFLKSAYIINAPRYYIIIFSLLKKMVSKELIQKVHVFGRDGWKESLIEAVGADLLPAFLGGNRTDPDGNPLCTTFVTHSGRIPEKYHMPNEKRWFKDVTQVKTILVYAKTKENVPLDVPTCKSVIQWEFFVHHKDIGFGLLYEEPESGVIEDVLPVQRYDVSDGTEKGSYKTEFAGKYFIVFDNSHSWMTCKEVEYCITVS